MPDLGEKLTEQRLEDIRKELERVYTEAAKDLHEKARAYLRQFERKDKEKQAAVAAGKITEQDRKNWLKGQVFTGKQWRLKIMQMSKSLVEVERTAVEIVHGGQIDCFADNANYFDFRIDRDNNFGGNFTLYDTETVTMLIEEQPELLRRRYVDGVKCEAWNRKVIYNCITQGIIQGESILQIAKRMARDTASTDMKAMYRYARTAMTGAQNAGRIRAMNDNIKQGIVVRKVWIAVADDRTRDAHLELDGQTADVNEPFDSELGPIMYPGDPSADDANVWNCRCALGYEYPDKAEAASEYGDDEDEFEEWLEEHEAA